ncbi:MAG: hypothetical protein OXG62_08455 [Nitrospinae bacterium]|nr:hypothetical protein [Nitrospinota bacterium]
MSKKTLLMLSGGPDSAAALWVAAQEGPVLAVHARFAPRQNRREAEETAARRIVEYVSGQSEHNIRLDVVDYDIPRDVADIVYDCYHLAGLEAVYLIAHKDIHRVTRVARNENLIESISVMRRERASMAVERMVNLSVERNEPFAWWDVFGWPNSMKRVDAHRLMPDHLVKMSISCRRPGLDGNGEWSPCGECFKCKGYLPKLRQPEACGYTELVFLSGGAGSATALWLAAREGPVLAIHVQFSNHPIRREVEEDAARRIVDYVREKSRHPVRFDVIKYTPAADTLGVAQNDMHHFASIRAAYVLAYADIERIWRAAPAHDAGYSARRGQTRRAWVAFHNALCRDRRGLEWRDPFGWPNPVLKEDALRMAPRELIDLTVSCRSPVSDGRGGWEACGRCHKCRGDWSYENGRKP